MNGSYTPASEITIEVTRHKKVARLHYLYVEPILHTHNIPEPTPSEPSQPSTKGEDKPPSQTSTKKEDELKGKPFQGEEEHSQSDTSSISPPRPQH